MPRFIDNQIQLGMCMGAGDADFDFVCSCVTSANSLTMPPGTVPHIVDWKNFLFKIREKLAHPYSFQKELDIHDMLREWRELAKDLIAVVSEAHVEVETCLNAVSHQREQTLAVSGRLLWGTMTLFVPPPVGVLLGALIYAATEDKWTGGLQKFVEWAMQTPQSYGEPGKLAPRVRPNRNPASNNSGGHANIRDLKDINQMINNVETIFGGARGKWLKALNESTLRTLVHVPALNHNMADVLEALVTDVCMQGQAFLKQALVQEMVDLIGDDTKLRRIVDAVQLAHMEYLYDPDSGEPTADIKPKSLIREGVALFLNRLAHEQVEAVQRARHAERATRLRDDILLKDELKRRIQLLLFAAYFNANREDYSRPLPSSRNPVTWQLPGRGQTPYALAEQFAIAYGVVPNAFFSSSYAGTFMNSLLGSPLEEKLVELGIIEKAAFQHEIDTWLPSPDTLPIPYMTVDAALRGRLRAWADIYAGDPVKLEARRKEIAELLLKTDAPKVLRVS